MDSNPQEQPTQELERTIDGQLFYHISKLKVWEKLEKTRDITQSNFDKLKDDITLVGVEDDLAVDSEGTVYDGKNRTNAVRSLLADHVTKSQNGKDIEWLPVKVVAPQTEPEKWRIALRKGEHFASWNPDELNNYLPEFEDVLDLQLINIDFKEPKSIEETLESMEQAYNATEAEKEEAKEKGEVNPNVEDIKIATCPECGHKFNVNDKPSDVSINQEEVKTPEGE